MATLQHSQEKKDQSPSTMSPDMESQVVAEDAVFGQVVEGGPDYRAVCFVLSVIPIPWANVGRSDGKGLLH